VFILAEDGCRGNTRDRRTEETVTADRIELLLYWRACASSCWRKSWKGEAAGLLHREDENGAAWVVKDLRSVRLPAMARGRS